MSQEEYKKEYEKYKNVEIQPGLYKKDMIEFEVLEIDEKKEKVKLKTVKSGVVKEKTLHWCRKYLRPA